MAASEAERIGARFDNTRVASMVGPKMVRIRNRNWLLLVITANTRMNIFGTR